MRFLRLVAVLAVCAGTPACTGSALLVSANLLETGVDVQRTRDLAYGDASRQRLDVYRPPQAAAPLPVVVFIHGGSWESGDKRQYRFVGNALAGMQAVAVLPNYRLYPEVGFPVYVEDAARAVAWAQAHAAEYGGDPARLYLMGHSAGAQIAALLALDPRYLRAAGATAQVTGFIGLSGPYDFLPLTSARLKKSLGPPERYPDTQPVRFVTAAAPPALLLQGTDDRVVRPENADSLARTYAAVGAQATLQAIPGGHGATLKPLGRPYRAEDPLAAGIREFIHASR
jgi:acetyl esterase/lipase